MLVRLSMCHILIRLQRMRGYGLHEAAVLYTLQADEAVGQLFHIGGLALHDQDLKTRVVIQMRVAG